MQYYLKYWKGIEMELTDLSRYLEIENPKVLPFSELREMKPVVLTADLELFQDTENIEYAKTLAKKGYEVVKVVRNAPLKNYKERIDFPRRILFEMTSKCNYFCKMCPQQNLKRPREHMDKDLYNKVVDDIDKFGVEGLWIYHLGESLLHPNFKEIIEHLKTKQNLGVIWLSTNGEFCDEKNRNTLINSNIDWINYSANATTEETYYKVIGKNSFKVVKENLDEFYKLKNNQPLKKPFLRVQMIEQESTKHEVDDFIKAHYKKASITSINMLEHTSVKGNDFGIEQRKREPLKSCLRISRNDCLINSNGVVTLCDEFYNCELNLGNIKEQPLAEIWNSTQRKEILKLNEEGRMSEFELCKNCADYDI